MPDLYRLRDMDLDEISLVESGDDPRGKVVIAKAAPKGTNEDKTGATLIGKRTREAQMPKDDQQETINKDDLPDEVVAYIDMLEDAVETLLDDDGDDADDVQKNEGDDDNDDEQDDALLKADPAIIEAISKADARAAAAEARAEEAEKIAKAERQRREKDEAISKAESLVMISDSKEDLAELLLALRDKAPDEAEKVEKLFRAANEQIAKGNLFTEIGRPGVQSTISKSVEARIEELRKDDPSLTREQAEVKVYAENPSLYDEQLQEG